MREGKPKGEEVSREVQIGEIKNKITTYRHDLGEAAEGMSGQMSAQDITNTNHEIETLEAELKKLEGGTE